MLEYWLWLTGRRGVGLRGLRALLEQFGTPEAVYCAAESDYPQELRPEGRASLADKELAPARQILQQCYRKTILDFLFLAGNRFQLLLQSSIFQVSFQPAFVIFHVHIAHLSFISFTFFG